MAQESLPTTKAALLEQVQTLSYHGRIALASKIGSQIKDAAVLSALVADLTSSGAGSGDQPVGKHYLELQLALAIATASRTHSQLLSDQVRSSSLFFKRLASKEVSRQSECFSDEELKKDILASNSATRKLLIQGCIKYRRVALLDSLVALVLESNGPDSVAKFLHGCSTEKIRETIRDPAIVNSSALKWVFLANHNSQLVLDLIRESLLGSAVLTRSEIWGKWWRRLSQRGVAFLIKHSKLAEELVDLWIAYPPVKLANKKAKPNDAGEYQAIDLTYEQPKIMSTELSYFFRHFNAKLWAFVVSSTMRTRDRTVTTALGGIDSVLRLQPLFANRCELVSKVLALTLDGLEQRELGDIGYPHLEQLLQVASYPKDALRLINNVAAHYTSICPDHTTYKTQYSSWQSNVISAASSIYSWVRRVYESKNKSLAAKQHRGHKLDSPGIDKAPFVLILDATFEQLVQPALPLSSPNGLNSLVSECTQFPSVVARLYDAIREKITGRDGKKWVEKSSYECRSVYSCFLRVTQDDVLYDRILNDALETFSNCLVNNLAYAFEFVRFRPSRERSLRLLTSFSAESLLQVARNDTGNLVSLLKTLAYDDYHQILTDIMTAGVSPSTREQLSVLQSIANNSVRATFHRAADSNSATERGTAYEQLLAITATSKCPVQFEKTLRFLQQKLKNEVGSHRSNVYTSVVQTATTDFITVLTTEHLQILEQMQRDLYDNPDESSSCLVESFSSELSTPLMRRAIRLWEAVLDPEPKAAGSNDLHRGETEEDLSSTLSPEALMNAGVQVQWIHAVQLQGAKRAARSFVLSLPHGYGKKNTSIRFLQALRTAYLELLGQDRLAERAAAIFIRPYENLNATIDLLAIPEFVELLKQQLELLKACPRDGYGLYDLEQCESRSTEYFTAATTSIERQGDRNALDVEVLAEYYQVLLRSTSAKRYAIKYLNLRLKQAKTTKRAVLRRITREVVDELLAISESAFLLKFVRRHLFNYDQQRLNAFLEPRFLAGPFNPRFTSYDETQERIAEIQAEIAESGDPVHESYFYMHNVFGLRKLLPSQIEKLKESNMQLALSPNQKAAAKRKALIRWSLLPSNTCADLIALHEEDSKAEEPRLGVRQQEALLSGLIHTDTPLAALQFLLDPRFLGGDRARVAVYAIARCMKYMSEDGLIHLVERILKSKKKSHLKITAHKELIRLLAAQPTDRNLTLIHQEWKHKFVHRDVRVAILQVALRLLSNESARVQRIGWLIVETAVQSDVTAVLVALLGTRPRSPVVAVKFSSGLAENTHILDHITDLSSILIENPQMQRFSESVVLNLADKPDSDIRFFALSAFYAWRLNEQGAPKLFKWLNDYSELPTRQDKISLYQNRWQRLAHDMVRMTGLLTRNNQQRTGSYASPQLAIDTIGALVKQIEAHAAREHRSIRTTLVSNLDFFMRLLPSNGPLRYYSHDIEKQLMAPIRNSATLSPLFTMYLFERTINQFDGDASDYIERAGDLIEELLSLRLVSLRSDADQLVMQLFKRIAKPARPERYALLFPIVGRLLRLEYGKRFLGTMLEVSLFRFVSRVLASALPTYYHAYLPEHVDELLAFVKRFAELPNGGFEEPSYLVSSVLEAAIYKVATEQKITAFEAQPPAFCKVLFDSLVQYYLERRARETGADLELPSSLQPVQRFVHSLFDSEVLLRHFAEKQHVSQMLEDMVIYAPNRSSWYTGNMLGRLDSPIPAGTPLVSPPYVFALVTGNLGSPNAHEWQSHEFNGALPLAHPYWKRVLAFIEYDATRLGFFSEFPDVLSTIFALSLHKQLESHSPSSVISLISSYFSHQVSRTDLKTADARLATLTPILNRLIDGSLLEHIMIAELKDTLSASPVRDLVIHILRSTAHSMITQHAKSLGNDKREWPESFQDAMASLASCDDPLIRTLCAL